MTYPNSDGPGAVDAVLTRVNFIDVVDADDFNYQDEQIRIIQSWLGWASGHGGLVGDSGTAAHGPGGLASPIADGGVAVTLAAKDNYASGKLLSVGDDNDGSYSEKLSVDFSGKISSDGLDVTADGALADPGHIDTVQTVTSTSNEIEVDCRDGLVVYHVLTENTEVQAPTNPTNGAELTFVVDGSAAMTVGFDYGSGKFWYASSFPMIVSSSEHLVVKFIYLSTRGWIEEWSHLVTTSIV